MLQRREANLFLGDIAIRIFPEERSRAFEFSFFTLADSGAFASSAPRRLNEALALVRPFHTNVWPLLLITVLVSGPIIYFVIYVPHFWERKSIKLDPRFHIENIREMRYGLNLKRRNLLPMEPEQEQLPDDLMTRCVWFSINLFLRQNASLPYGGTKVRILVAIFWLSATYILGDVYSAQLTSQFARPARESPIG